MIADLTDALHDMLMAHPLIIGTFGDPPPIFEHVPSGQTFPYVTYGPHRSEDISADGAIITAHDIRLTVWSRYTGRAEVLALTEALSTAIMDGDIALSGATITARRIGLIDIFLASDGYTRSGVLRVRITTDTELETA